MFNHTWPHDTEAVITIQRALLLFFRMQPRNHYLVGPSDSFPLRGCNFGHARGFPSSEGWLTLLLSLAF